MSLAETRAQFAAAVEAAGGRAAVADILDCSPQFVWMLMKGYEDKRPGLDMRLLIEERFGIPFRAWTEGLASEEAAPQESVMQEAAAPPAVHVVDHGMKNEIEIKPPEFELRSLAYPSLPRALAKALLDEPGVQGVRHIAGGVAVLLSNTRRMQRVEIREDKTIELLRRAARFVLEYRPVD